MKKRKHLIPILAGLCVCLASATLFTACEEEHTHSYTEIITAPTCTEQGFTTHTCACSDSYVDTYVDALGHDFQTYISNGDATCTENGTETATCSRQGCEEKDTRTDENSALDHDYGMVTYTWIGNQCTAERICSHDNTHKEIETVVATYVKDTDATCETEETGHYQATFENTAFSTQNTVAGSVVEGEPLNHNYGAPTYTWNGYECTATRVCGRDSTHIETETVTGVYVKDSDATCETAETGHYQATFENPAFLTQNTVAGGVMIGEELGHDYGEWISNNDGTHTQTCFNDSNHKITKGCNGGTATCTEKAICKDCGIAYGGTLEHTYDQTVVDEKYLESPADYDNAASYYYSCICGAAGTETFESGDALEVFAESITLNKTEATVNLGESLNLIETILPENTTDKTVTWNSSDETVAKVVNGAVSTLNMGMVTITATTTNGKTAECVLTVLGNAVIQYERKGGFYIVTGLKGKTDKLEIPFLYDGLRVKSIQAYAFYGNTDLKEVILPNSVEYIYANAFMNCSNLEKINLPESLTYLGESAFENCTSLKEITIPYLTETIYTRAFYNCTALKCATLCEGVKHIGVSAFAACTALETVTLENGLETINDNAFDTCKSLKNFEMPNTVKHLGDFAFRYAEALESVTFSTGLTAIGIGCFQSCVSLDNVELHAGIVSFGESCFSWCSGMKTLRILGDVMLLDDSSFYECTSLENIYYASSISGDLGINNYVFYNAGINGKGITFTLSANACIPDGLFEPQGKLNRPKLVKLIVEDGATKVDYLNAYNTLPYLEEIVLPDTITYIKKGCFDNTAWWNNHADGAVYICNIFYGYKGTLTGEFEITNNTVCIAMAALEGQTPTSLIVPFVGATADKLYNAYLGYIFGAVGYDSQATAIPETLTNVMLSNCLYEPLSTALYNWSGAVEKIHSWEDVETLVKETCQTTGVEKQVCSVCKKDTTRVRPIDVTAHTASGVWLNDESSHWQVCIINGCTEKAIEELNHEWNDWVLTLEPTCQTKGSRYHVCSTCNYMAVEEIAVNSEAHNEDNAWLNDAENHWRKCLNEGCEEKLSFISHHWNDWVVTLEPTCQTKGSRYHVCSTCNYRAVEDIAVNSEAHNEDNAWLNDAENHWRKCLNEGCEEKLSFISHHWNDWVVTLEPTCQTQGSRYHVCSVCEYTATENVAIDSNAHDVADTWQSDANGHWGICTIDGCGVALEVVAHDWDDWVITLEPTCQTQGSRYHVCSVCDYKAVEEIAIVPNAHNVDSEWKNDANEHWHKCLIVGCSEKIDNEDHEWSDWVVTLNPNCKTVGSKYRVCSICNYKAIADIPINPDAHLFNEEDICEYCGKEYNPFGLEFTFDNNTSTYSVTGYIGTESDVVIPASYRAYPVTSIGTSAFSGCACLTSVAISEGIINIGSNAFYNCANLTSITMPSTLVSIGSCAFTYCTGLKKVNILDLAAWCNLSCASAPNPLNYAKNLYINGEIVKDLIIPKGVTVIRDGVFENLNIESIFIPSTVTSLDENEAGNAFIGCNIKKSIEVEKGNPIYHSSGNCLIKTASKTVVLGCGNSVIPNDGSVTKIGEYAFMNCRELHSIVVPEGVTYIEAYAFSGCKNLTNITIASTVTAMWSFAFNNCNNLEMVIFGDPSGWYDYNTPISEASLANPYRAAEIIKSSRFLCWQKKPYNS